MMPTNFNFLYVVTFGLTCALMTSCSLGRSLETEVYSNRTQSGKQFIGYNLYMNFMDYIEHCHKLGLQPANVLNKEENDVLTTYLDGNFADPKYFWLGGSDIGREERYYWIASLSEFSFTSWGPGYPNGGREENCATIYGGDGTWYDQYCSNDGVQPLCQTIP
ncbi:unnamed protein product [Orchesella dallaii]|uniref:C-type lectin domain-containing protein n=1 Tax=Orchesella dallaii TaxID=48710 RepID=A0ABP1QVP4_9HEXA